MIWTMMYTMDCRRAAHLAGSVSPADQAWALLLQVAFELVHAHFAAAVAELDLAPVQAKALHELNVEPPISMRELAERLKGLALTAAGAKMRERLFARLYTAPHAVAELSERDQRILADVLQRILSV